MLRPCLEARLALAIITILGATAVFAQDYPTKPIRIITAAAGGGGDFTTRQIAQGITGPLGQPVIVENRTAFLAAEAVSKAPPDGYTLTVSGGSVWITPLLRKAPYDIANDFSPVALISREVKEKFFNAGIEIVAGSPEQFATAVKSEMANLGKVIKDAGIKAD